MQQQALMEDLLANGWCLSAHLGSRSQVRLIEPRQFPWTRKAKVLSSYQDWYLGAHKKGPSYQNWERKWDTDSARRVVQHQRSQGTNGQANLGQGLLNASLTEDRGKGGMLSSGPALGRSWTQQVKGTADSESKWEAKKEWKRGRLKAQDMMSRWGWGEAGEKLRPMAKVELRVLNQVSGQWVRFQAATPGIKPTHPRCQKHQVSRSHIWWLDIRMELDRMELRPVSVVRLPGSPRGKGEVGKAYV